MSRDELRRTIERPAQRVGLTVEPELVEALLTDVDGRPARCRCCRPRCSSCGAGATGRACASRRTRAAAASRAPSRAWPRTPSCGWTPRSRRRPASSCCASPTRTRAARSCAAGSSSPSSTPSAAGRSSTGSPTAACSRSRDGAVEVAHEALLREWPRLRGWLDEDVAGPAAASRGSASPRAPGTPTIATPASSTAARASPRRSSGRPATRTSSNATERAFLDEGRRASGRAQRRLRMVLAGVASLLVLAVIAGLVALDQRGRARDRGHRGGGAGPRRPGARRSGELDRALLLARQGMALDDTLADAQQPARHAAQEPGGDRRAARRRRRADERRPQPRRPHAGVRRHRRHAAPARCPHAAPAGAAADRRRPPTAGWTLRFSDDGSRLAAGGGEPLILDPRTQRVHAQAGHREAHRTGRASRRTGARCSRSSTIYWGGTSSSASTRAAAVRWANRCSSPAPTAASPRCW